MVKPINVEAQRISKILEETQANFKVLSLLTSDLFREVASRNEEDLKVTFGPQAGALLFAQAEAEAKFDTVNMAPDRLHMENLMDGDFEGRKDLKNEAIRNAKSMRSNIMKLIHIFKNEAMQNKLQREFRPVPNEIANFQGAFAEMRRLWMIRLTTSLEETIRMHEQVETSGKRVKDLTKTLDDKRDQLEKFQKNAKEHKEARIKEIENLKSAKGDLRTEKNTKENELTRDGQKIKESNKERHTAKMISLQREIDTFNGELTEVKQMNTADEKQLVTQYDGADKQYTEALASYDVDMADKTKEKNEALTDCTDAEYQLKQFQEQWEERMEERRKRDNLKAIMDKKEAEQRKKRDTLNKAAQFLQAHYRGMVARRDMAKASKGKKGKRRKK